MLNIFTHHETGNNAIIKSPHLPCALYEVVILGENFKVRFLTNLIKIIKYNTNQKLNQNHHQYCQWVKFNKTSAETVVKVGV